jgi:hypothetical protein
MEMHVIMKNSGLMKLIVTVMSNLLLHAIMVLLVKLIVIP